MLHAGGPRYPILADDGAILIEDAVQLTALSEGGN